MDYESVTLLKLFGTKLFRKKRSSDDIVDAGRNTTLLINHLSTNKLHLIGHESKQCNLNGYVEDYANPTLDSQDKTVIRIIFFNQAFRTYDRTFPRPFAIKCSSKESAKMLLSLLMLGVSSAKDLNEKRSRERDAAKLAIYHLETDVSSSESDDNDSDEGENEDKEGKEGKSDGSEESEEEDLFIETQDWPVEPLRPSKWCTK